MDLILDTHALLWLTTGDVKPSPRLLGVLAGSETRCFASAVTAWEYSDLHARGRLPGSIAFSLVEEELGLKVLDFPAELWRQAERLPNIHRDPVDRMVVAHALALGMTLVSVDKQMRRYPVPTLW